MARQDAQVEPEIAEAWVRESRRSHNYFFFADLETRGVRQYRGAPSGRP